MAVKILKLGKTIIERAWTVVCYKCESKLEYKDSDISSIRNEEFIVCPNCKSFINHKL